MHSNYAHQVEHVRLGAKKQTNEHKVTCGELNTNSLQNFAHCTASCLQKTKQHPHKQQTTPTPQNKSLRTQKLQQLVEVQKSIQKSPNLPHQT
jgi:hypothetical protein